jgi:predicted DNA-binding protein (MmcQ/YjbR family)
MTDLLTLRLNEFSQDHHLRSIPRYNQVMTLITLETLRDYCCSKPGVVETFPFGEETLVFKVMGKMFALTNISSPGLSVNLKCDPDWSLILRDHYAAIKPGYHMNKRHWNTVIVDGAVPNDEFWEMVDHSYRLVVAGLKKTDREELAALGEGSG